MGVPLLIGLLSAAVVAGGCFGSDESERTDSAERATARTRVVVPATGATVELPGGWQLLDRRISGIIDPVQVFAAASYPVDVGRHPPGGTCRPGQVLADKPADGALVQIVESSSRPPPRNVPPREHPFRLRDKTYASYECNGPSYNIAFRDRGRRFQAFVWIDPGRVDPHIREQAIQLLSSMRFDPDPTSAVRDNTAAPSRGLGATQPCPLARAGPLGAGNWRGRVANISCEAAGRLILRRLGREFRPTTAQSGTHQSAGFRCTWRTLSDEPGWRLACVRGDEAITFDWTP
jgi:hypothetical protein